MNHESFILIPVSRTQKDLLKVEGGGNGELPLNVYKFLFGMMKMFWKWIAVMISQHRECT